MLFQFIKSIFFIAFLFPNLTTADSPELLEREVYLMGTSFHIALYESDREKALSDLEAIIKVVEETENQLSTWKPNSELSTLNQFPLSKPFAMSSSLCAMWENMEPWVSQTDGAFDPSVGSLTRVWGIHDSFRIPKKSEIQTALASTGFQLLKRTGCVLIKTRPVQIDPGAFGKGEAIDRVLQLAEDRRMGPLFIDFGGQLAVRGTLPQQPGWESWLANPIVREQESTVEMILKEGSLSTSGGSERDGYVKGKRIGHHMDPKSGYPVPSFGSVSVWRKKGLEADMLSTALYVMGPQKGYEWALKHQVAACFLVVHGEKIEVLPTPSFVSLISNQNQSGVLRHH
jgi:thiamine biosynthesis lipoprotein